MQLNQEQHKAVEANAKNVLVLAPPGSGKTRVIVERTAYLIKEKKVSPYDILLLTFTRKAAGEMRERLEQRIGMEAHKLTIGTFHAVALKLLHQFGDLIGFRQHNSTVYGDFEEKYLLKEVAIDLGFHTGKAWKKIKKKDIDAVFSKYYQEGIEPDRFAPGYALFKAFIQRTKENNSYTYGSLLTGLKLLLPQIHQYLNWKHIITDESQDTDRLQWSLLRSIQGLCGTSLFCVCDTDQAIYDFRGADVEYLIRHQGEFNVHTLKINYRSDKNIVVAANKLIAHNERRISKDIEAFEDAQTPIDVLKDKQSLDIVQLIRSLTAKAPKAERAVLARNHILLRKLSQLLTEENISHVYIGEKTALTNSEEFRKFHSFLKLIVNEYDNFSFLLIRDLIGLSRKEYNEIRKKAVTEGMSHFQAWTEPDLWGFYHILKEADINLNDLELIIEMISHCLDDAGWTDYAKNILPFIVSWIEKNPGKSIQDYLNWLATYDISDEVDKSYKGLQLMTMHAAKGLEFPAVIIAGVNEGLIPSSQAIKADDIEGERRLFYVAITRAENKLIVTSRPEITEAANGKIYENPVSRFIGEMV